MTPLHVAAERAYNDIMEVLQKHGAKVHTCMCSLVPTELRYTHIYTPDTPLHSQLSQYSLP